MSIIPNEIWFLIAKSLRYIDVLSLSLTSKRFHQVCLSFDKYKKKLRLSKQLVGYDVDVLFDFFNETIKNLLEDIKASFEDVFVDRKFIFSNLELFFI